MKKILFAELQSSRKVSRLRIDDARGVFSLDFLTFFCVNAKRENKDKMDLSKLKKDAR